MVAVMTGVWETTVQALMQSRVQDQQMAKGRLCADGAVPESLRQSLRDASWTDLLNAQWAEQATAVSIASSDQLSEWLHSLLEPLAGMTACGPSSGWTWQRVRTADWRMLRQSPCRHLLRSAGTRRAADAAAPPGGKV